MVWSGVGGGVVWSGGDGVWSDVMWWCVVELVEVELLELLMVHLPSLPPSLRKVTGYQFHLLVSVSFYVSSMPSAHRLGASLRLHTPGWRSSRFPLWQTPCTHHKSQHW